MRILTIRMVQAHSGRKMTGGANNESSYLGHGTTLSHVAVGNAYRLAVRYTTIRGLYHVGQDHTVV